VSAILEVRNLTVAFGDGGSARRAVDDISFTVGEGEFFLVIGESGSGKSLTGGAIAGLNPAAARQTGSVRFKGREILNLPEGALRRVRGEEIGVVYQNPLSAMNPVCRVGDQIAEAMIVHGKANRAQAARRAAELLERVHIPDPARVARAYPHEVSGGMRQRAMIAMAIACDPALLIADEPTTALDVTIKAQILDLLLELRRERALTVILITHDMGVVAQLADRVVVMYAGKIAEIGAADVIMNHPAHPYTDALMSSGGLAGAPFKSDLRAIKGSPPTLEARPPGCRFHPRCPRAQARCEVEAPELRPVGETSAACHFPLAAAREASRHAEVAS
jgi:oligopeptide/dipeptide ABC transporter ATP-binding protein